MWNRVNRLKGRQSHSLPLIDTQGDSQEVQADFLVEHVEYASSESHYTEPFLKLKENAE